LKTGARVRRAKVADLDEMMKNLGAVAKEGRYIWTERAGEKEREYPEKLIKDKGCLVLVAEVGAGRKRKLVGSLTMTRYGQKIVKSQHVRVLGMLVVDGYREVGIGKGLMKEAIAWAKRKPGVEKVVLGVFSNNKRAKGLYDKFGFVVEGVRKVTTTSTGSMRTRSTWRSS
jgi:ribosomal protein S18 acetylase RimI-like enzyme